SASQAAAARAIGPEAGGDVRDARRGADREVAGRAAGVVRGPALRGGDRARGEGGRPSAGDSRGGGGEKAPSARGRRAGLPSRRGGDPPGGGSPGGERGPAGAAPPRRPGA